ncbi:MAG: hypothetical protein RI907_167 [Pseudomonadota bacterium]
MKKYRFSAQGFTLVELMVTISVMVILGMMAAPAMQAFLAKSSMQSLQADFSQTMQQARAEAVNRNTCVSVCQLKKTNSVAGCEFSESAAGNWHKGWVMFTNPSCKGLSSDDTALPSGASILRVREPGNPRYELSTASVVQLDLTFNSRGLLLSDGTTLWLMDAHSESGGVHRRRMVVSPQGRVLAQVLSEADVAAAAGRENQ